MFPKSNKSKREKSQKKSKASAIPPTKTSPTMERERNNVQNHGDTSINDVQVFLSTQLTDLSGEIGEVKQDIEKLSKAVEVNNKLIASVRDEIRSQGRQQSYHYEPLLPDEVDMPEFFNGGYNRDPSDVVEETNNDTAAQSYDFYGMLRGFLENFERTQMRNERPTPGLDSMPQYYPHRERDGFDNAYSSPLSRQHSGAPQVSRSNSNRPNRKSTYNGLGPTLSTKAPQQRAYGPQTYHDENRGNRRYDGNNAAGPSGSAPSPRQANTSYQSSRQYP